MTLADLQDRWLNCKRCKLHRFRRNVVLGRGDVPAPYLFIGEAPGPTEDLRAMAFIGPAGRCFRKALALAAKEAGLRGVPRYYVSNVLGCLPHDSRQAKFRKPRAAEVLACRPRVADTLVVVQPKHIILLGRVAEKECKALCPDGLHLRHPSFLRRTGGTEGPEFPRFVRALEDLWRATCKPEWVPKKRKVVSA